jgi:hypothetical protein
MKVRVPGGSGGLFTSQIPIADGSGLVVASNVNGIANAAPTLGRLIFAPYFTGWGGKIDAIGISTTVAAAAGGIARVGIYNSRVAAGAGLFSRSPGTVFFDAGQIDTTVAPGTLLITGLNLIIPANQLLWLASVASVAAPTWRVAAAVTGMLPLNAALSGPASCQILNGQNAAVALPDVSGSNFNGPSNAPADEGLVFIRFVV